MLSIVTGLPGSSKSYITAQQGVYLVERNKRWYKKTGIVRPVYENLGFSPKFREYAGDFLKSWDDPAQLPQLKNCDVLWEEMGAHVDSRSWEQMPIELRRWLQQHRHRGVEIWGNCQDFADIDVAIRRLTNNLTYLMKIAGSRDPSPTTPPPKIIWGVILKMEMDPRTYDEKEKFKDALFSGFEFIRREGIELYSMFNDVRPGKYPPLSHRERVCPTCNYKKVIHV